MASELVVERLDEARRVLAFRALVTPFERLRGLLGTTSDEAPVALIGCDSVHTFGMRYHLDVAFVGSSGVVLEVRRSVPPARVLTNRRAWITLERPHVRGPWLVRGERLRMHGITRRRESDHE